MEHFKPHFKDNGDCNCHQDCCLQDAPGRLNFICVCPECQHNECGATVGPVMTIPATEKDA